MGAGMWYVLQPDDRPLLDAFMTDNFYGAAGAVFQSLVAGRADGTVPEHLVQQWPVAEQVSILLPARWAAEVALWLPPERAALRDAVLDGMIDRGQGVLHALAARSDTPLGERAAAVLGTRANPPAEAIAVRLLGQQHLQIAGHQDMADWRRGRVRALFAFPVLLSRTAQRARRPGLFVPMEKC